MPLRLKTTLLQTLTRPWHGYPVYSQINSIASTPHVLSATIFCQEFSLLKPQPHSMSTSTLHKRAALANLLSTKVALSAAICEMHLFYMFSLFKPRAHLLTRQVMACTG